MPDPRPDAASPLPPTPATNVYQKRPVGAVPNPAMPVPDAHDAAFAAAANRVLADAAELARALVPSHQAAAAVVVAGDWSTVRKHFSLSAKYARWADYAAPARGFGTHAWLLDEARRRAAAADRAPGGERFPMVVRYTQAELEAHPAWMGFGTERDAHPPMRGWMAAPIVGRDGTVWGLLQLSDRDGGAAGALEGDGDYTAADEAAFARLARLVTTALEALWDARLLRRGEAPPA